VNITNLKKLLKEHNIEPNKRLGQNFLIDNNIVEKLIKNADIFKDDIILEIGSGLGTLTKEIAKQAKKVITIEKDKKLIEILKEVLRDYENIEIINEDILKYKLDLKNYKIIANIPYYLTSHLIRMFFRIK